MKSLKFHKKADSLMTLTRKYLFPPILLYSLHHLANERDWRLSAENYFSLILFNTLFKTSREHPHICAEIDPTHPLIGHHSAKIMLFLSSLPPPSSLKNQLSNTFLFFIWSWFNVARKNGSAGHNECYATREISIGQCYRKDQILRLLLMFGVILHLRIHSNFLVRN